MLLLDVSGAYDYVSHTRLLFDMKGIRVGFFVPWVESFLTGRSTRIKMPGFLSDQFPIPTGIPQGSLISPNGVKDTKAHRKQGEQSQIGLSRREKRTQKQKGIGKGLYRLRKKGQAAWSWPSTNLQGKPCRTKQGRAIHA
jgi:hypothetical protein